MTTAAEVMAGVKALKDLRLGASTGGLNLDDLILRIIAIAVLHAAEDERRVAAGAPSE